MNSNRYSITFLFAALTFVGLIAVGGCKKSEPADTTTLPEVKDITPVAGEQTICPVMAGAIDKTIFVEYKGKKVYFCCEGCKEKFEAEPEKYLAKLPQFK